MCLAIPAEVLELLPNEKALVSIGGVKKEISLSLLSERVEVNDFVVIHVGFAIGKLDEKEARKTLNDFNTMLKEDS